MATKVVMPQLGESVVEGTVTQWLFQEGERVKEYEPLLEVNTDKVDTEIPSPTEGVLLKIVVPAGTTVRAGSVLAWIGEAGEDIPESDSSAVEPKPAPQEDVAFGEATRPMAATPPRPRRELGFISPVVAHLAQEHNVDLSQVRGSGMGGRITKRDVLNFSEERRTQSPPPAASPPGAPLESPAWETPGEGDLFRPTEMMFGEAKQPKTTPPQPPATERVIPLTPVRKAIADHMLLSKRTSAHVTTVMEADLQAVTQHLAAHKPVYARDNVRLTYTAYFVAAAVEALKEYRIFNASLTEKGLLLHPTVNIGVAVSLGEDGLIVPIIRHAEAISLLGLARAIADLAQRARNRQLKPEEVQGGTFSITNHGVGRSLFATPIINQPQCAILGVGVIQKRAVVIHDAIAIRPMVYLSLTFDHRIIDGAIADGFLAKVVERLENWR